MKRISLVAVGSGLLLLTSAALSQPVQIRVVRPGVGVDTTELDCKRAKGKDSDGNLRSCEMVVLVRPSTPDEQSQHHGAPCIAVIPVQTIRLSKGVTLNFTLARSRMTDTAQYRFITRAGVMSGIRWVDGPGSEEMEPGGLSDNDTRAIWKAGKKFASDYEPAVEMISAGRPAGDCKALDPRIANDG